MRATRWFGLFGMVAGFASGGTLGRPNVVLIMADDQGLGDLGVSGNPVLRTPRIDRLAGEGARFQRFYVSPVCAPTRASLLTGRYGYRARVVDTYQGRAMMDPAEVTLAEHLSAAGYRCGVFGKWHLGDNAPMRPHDQGFHESLVHRGGGISQPSDPPGGSSYFDPILARNGTLEKTKGYCSDVYTDAAIAFAERSAAAPFFVYLAFNAPHVPLEVPKSDLDVYMSQDLSPVYPPGVDPATLTPRDRETIARVYGMVANIDANIGRLLDALDRLNLREKTLVIFLTDNGPQQARFNAGLRGQKGSVYEGGIRVPSIWRLPGSIAAGRVLETPAAHIDVVPTILEACGVQPLGDAAFDGRSVWPVLTGAVGTLPDRPYFVQWHRGDIPQRERACAVVTQRWKAAQPAGVPEGPFSVETAPWQLFDLEADPGERRDLAAEFPDQVERLRKQYLDWFAAVSSTRGFDPPRIALGSDAENPTDLTPQDWRADAGDASPVSVGHWLVEVMRPGRYSARLRFAAPKVPSQLVFSMAGQTQTRAVGPDETALRIDDFHLPSGPARIDAWLEPVERGDETPTRRGVRGIAIERVGDEN